MPRAETSRGILARLRRALLFAVFTVVAALLLLAVVEGLASFALFARGVLRERTDPALQERLHTTHDPLLGWIHEPNLELRGIYGPGTVLRTNGQSFRNDEDFGTEVPEGRVRAICSGDSFTLGYGVSNGETWCDVLTRIDPRLQTVNMGQGGYGLDQAFLWYERDAAALEHDVAIMAFITDDIRRMSYESFWGYPKPRIVLRGRKLVVTNTPVPMRSFWVPWLVGAATRAPELRILELLAWRESEAERLPEPVAGYDPRPVASAIFRRLADRSREQGRTLVVVHLPTKADFALRSSRELPRFERELAGRGILFVDMIEAIRRRAPERDAYARLFDEHYSVAGHRAVAEELYRRLAEQPEITAKLARSAAGP